MNYHIARDGQQLGVFSQTEVSAKLQTGEFRSSDLCWAEGMADWETLGSRGLTASVTPSYAPAPTGYNPYAPPSVDVRKIGFGKQGSFELAGLGERLGAVLLNLLTVFALAIPLGIGAALSDKPETSGLAVILYSVAGLAFLGLAAYNLYLLVEKGQSLGKKWLGIKIVSYEDATNAGFVKAVLLRGVVNGLIGAFVPFYGIVDICFICREDRRCLHDLIAGTTVVKVQK